jgi:hypothetical protein
LSLNERTPLKRRMAYLLERPANRWLEPLLAAVVAAGLIKALIHFYVRGFLPQPFFYQPDNIWGDWFNVVYWAYDKGTYDTFGTVYPPLTYVFLRIFSLSRCYPISGAASDLGAGLAARACDWVGILTSHLIYVLMAILVAVAFTRQNRSTAPWRSYALAAGFPMLEALDRNNLIILTFTLVVLAYGPFLKTAWMRWLCVGLAINFKIYVVATLGVQLLRRRWLWVEGATLATVAVYLVSYAILQRGTPMEIMDNLSAFSGAGAYDFMDVWFPATYLALYNLIDNWMSPVQGLIGSYWTAVSLTTITVLMRGTQLSILAAAAAIWLRPEVISRHRVTNLGISLALITSESGGYTMPLVFFFTFMEPWRGIGPKWAIIAVYLLCIPFDIPIQYAPPVVRDLFWPNRTVLVDYYFGVGPVLRPLLLLSIPFALSMSTIRTVWIDVRAQGWRSRRRYDGDFPLLLEGGKRLKA